MQGRALQLRRPRTERQGVAQVPGEKKGMTEDRRTVLTPRSLVNDVQNWMLADDSNKKRQ